MTAVLLAVTLVLLPGAAHAHAGHGDAAPWRACEALDVGETCAFTTASGDLHRGSCRQVQDHAMCVRNQPIVPADDGSGAARTVIAAWLAGLALVGLTMGLRRVV